VKRRQFITLIGGPVATLPLAVRAQQGERVRRIGVLMGYPESDQEAQAWYAAFREGLQTLGWTEGHNLRIALRWRASNAESAQRLAKHTPCNAGRAQNERHEVSRNMREGSVVLGRRLPLKDEFLHTVTL
jgi:hypothetical protein